jgi:hypothetical protein
MLAAGVLLTLPLAACDIDSLLDVDDPAVATPASLNDPAVLDVLVRGAVGDFQVAWNGSSLRDTYVSVTGLFTDELHTSDTFTTREDTDQRTINPLNNNTDLIFRDLQRARRSAQDAANSVIQLAGEDDERLGVLYALQGYSIIGLAEAFCGNVPLSNFVNDEFETTPGFTTNQLLTEAINRFNQALAAAAEGSDDYYLAAVGKARAQLGLKNYAGAAQTIADADIPLEWSFQLEYSENTSRQENDLWNLNISNSRYSMSNSEAGEGLPYRTAKDLRAPWVFSGINGFDGVTPLYYQLRYFERGSNLPLATGAEAQLIIAEAQLNGAYPGDYIATLNELRENALDLMIEYFENFDDLIPDLQALGFPLTLAPLTDPGDMAADVDLLFRERGFWLQLTGHRLGDLRRLVRNYERPQTSVFPSGAFFKGDNYGAQVAFPIPFDEQNNPDYNPAQCVVTQA